MKSHSTCVLFSVDGQSSFVNEELSHLATLPQIGENAPSSDSVSGSPEAASSDAVAAAAGAAIPAAMPAAGPNIDRQNSVVMKKELAKIQRHNLNVRAAAYKEVRKPGKSKWLLNPIIRRPKISRFSEIRTLKLQDVLKLLGIQKYMKTLKFRDPLNFNYFERKHVKVSLMSDLFIA